MESLKLVDPNWMGWRLLRRDRVELADGTGKPGDYLSWHPFNFLMALALNYHGWYKIKPDGWHEVSKDEPVIYFNQPTYPGFGFSRWEKVKRPE